MSLGAKVRDVFADTVAPVTTVPALDGAGGNTKVGEDPIRLLGGVPGDNDETETISDEVGDELNVLGRYADGCMAVEAGARARRR
jgi:hypothetical protein